MQLGGAAGGGGEGGGGEGGRGVAGGGGSGRGGGGLGGGGPGGPGGGRRGFLCRSSSVRRSDCTRRPRAHSRPGGGQLGGQPAHDRGDGALRQGIIDHCGPRR